MMMMMKSVASGLLSCICAEAVAMQVEGEDRDAMFQLVERPAAIREYNRMITANKNNLHHSRVVSAMPFHYRALSNLWTGVDGQALNAFLEREDFDFMMRLVHYVDVQITDGRYKNEKG